MDAAPAEHAEIIGAVEIIVAALLSG